MNTWAWPLSEGSSQSLEGIAYIRTGAFQGGIAMRGLEGRRAHALLMHWHSQTLSSPLVGGAFEGETIEECGARKLEWRVGFGSKKDIAMPTLMGHRT